MDTFPDLFWNVAEALQNHAHPQEALQFYLAINDRDQVLPSSRGDELLMNQFNIPTTWAAMGRCYAALRELQQAEECFALTAKENPVDYDSRLRLAEIYEATDRKEQALQVIEAGLLTS